MSDVLTYLEAFAATHLQPLGVRLLVAASIFFIGRWVAKAFLRGLDGMMERSAMDISLRKFLRDIAYAAMLVAVVIIALDAIGIETTTFVAVLGAAGLAVGLALQGSLSNFAAGVMLIVLRPYKVTDLVQLGKYVGRVEAIRIFHTILITPDHREVSLPNAKVIAGEIENLTALGRRRVDLVVTLSEISDLERAQQLARDAVEKAKDVLAAPPPEVAIAEVSDTAVKLTVRPWATAETHASVASDAMSQLRSELAAAGVKFTVAQAPVA